MLEIALLPPCPACGAAVEGAYLVPPGVEPATVAHLACTECRPNEGDSTVPVHRVESLRNGDDIQRGDLVALSPLH